MARVLGRIRLSRLTDESTSTARQRELIEQWSAMNDHQIVGWAEDLDVSGSVDPFDTPSLGPWFREDKRVQWDILVAWKLDRIGRRAIPLNKVFGWMLEHEKTLVCVSDNIDLSTWVGRLVANVLAGVAEGEIEAIKERTRASRRKLLTSGRWPGGQVPFGFTAVELPEGGWVLATDHAKARVVTRIVEEVIRGSAIEAVANRLNDDGIPAPKGGEWLPSSIWKIVTGKYLLGHATYGGETVRGPDGLPVLNAEPLVTREQWGRLQEAIKERRAGSRTKTTSPLLGVVVCAVCGKPLFHKIYRRNYGKGLYRYYHCRDKSHGKQMDAEPIEYLLADSFIREVGWVPLQEARYIPAEDHQIELEEAIRAVEELTSVLGTITSATVRSSITGQLAALDSRIAALESLPKSTARWEYRDLEQTYADEWNLDEDVQRRRALLVKSGITAEASPGYFHFRIPPDLIERMRSI